MAIENGKVNSGELPRDVNASVALVIGVFDFCHQGHVRLLEQASERSSRLVVGVHTDEEVRRYKGAFPVNSALERQASIADLGLADVVEINSDRMDLCRKHDIEVIYHGDDWSREQYLDHLGSDILEKTAVRVELLPHTSGISSLDIRQQIPPIGWWLYSPNPRWTRRHLFDHIRGLYQQIGGIWIVGEIGREIVKETFPDAPCVWLEDECPLDEAAKRVSKMGLKLLVFPHFNYDAVANILASQGSPQHMVILSHGRSGKKLGSAEAVRCRGFSLSPQKIGIQFDYKGLMIYDWSAGSQTYCHLDGFLNSGGSLNNQVPLKKRPSLLVLPTWGPRSRKNGLLLSSRWIKALAQLADTWDIVLSPHPLTHPGLLDEFVHQTRARLLPAKGRSFEAVPDANVVLCDLSGVFWESLLFDTPVLLAAANEEWEWPDDQPPTFSELSQVVETIQPAQLAERAKMCMNKRDKNQRALAEQRLGTIDGQASGRLVRHIDGLLQEREGSGSPIQTQ